MKLHFSQVASIAAGLILGSQGADIMAAKSSQIVYGSQSPNGEAIFLHDTKDHSRFQLSDPLEVTRTIDYFILDAKEKNVAYLADRETTDILELYAVSLKTGLNVKANGPLVEGGNVVDMEFDGKGKSLFYKADQDVDNFFEIYKSDLKKKTVTQLTPDSMRSNVEIIQFAPLPSGAGVVYLADLETTGKYELFLSTSSDEPARKLNLQAANAEGDIYWFELNAKGTGALFLGDLDVEGQDELYYVDLKKGGVEKINDPLPASASVSAAAFDPKGKSIIYLADQEVAAKDELYKADVKSGIITKISQEIADDRSVRPNFSIDSKGAYVTYLVNADTPEVNDVYRVSLKKGEREKVNATVAAGSNYGAAMDGKANVYFIGDQNGPAAIDFFGKDMKSGTFTRIDDPALPTAHVYQAFVELKGAGALYWTMNMANFQFSYVYYDSKSETRTSLAAPGEYLWQVKLLNSSEVALEAR